MQKKWYYLEGGEVHGPFGSDKIIDLVRVGVIGLQTPVWSDELAEWTPLEDLPGFKDDDSIPGEPPPLPSKPPALPVERKSASRASGPLQKQEDHDTANFMARASATVLVLMFLGSVYALFTSESNSTRDVSSPLQTAVEEKWPSVFESAERPSLPDARGPSLNSALAEDIAFTFGFRFGQREQIEKISREYPEIGERLVAAQAKFDSRFGPAFRRMDDILAEETSKWPERKQELRNESRRQIQNGRASLDWAKDFLTEVEERAEGDVPSPVLEALLMFHPKYIRHPELQFVDGYTREYRTDGSGKAKGVKIGIEHPASWKAKEGRRPHVVQTFRSENGHGAETALILIREIPEPVSDDEILQLDGSEILELAPPEAEALESGKVQIAGKPAVWSEFKSSENRAGIKIDMHGLAFTMLHKNCLIQVTYMAGQPSGVSEANVDLRFQHYAGLFQMMTNSIDFFDRYE